MAWNRWEWLEGLEPESLVDAAVRQMAGLVADALADWPPEVALHDGQSKFSTLFEASAPRPGAAAFAEAIRRARWELERNFDAIDYYERNHQLAQACPQPRDQLAAEFIQHYILESFYFLMEKTDYRVKRKSALVGLDLLERRLTARLRPH